MPALPLTVGHYGRPRVGLPTLRLVNAYPEVTKEGPSQLARIPRPGLTLWHTLGSGPIQRQYQDPGLFGGDLFSVSGGALYRGTTSLGSVPYSLQPRMAANLTQLAVVSGGALYVYDGTTLAPVEFFDDGASRLPPFSGVAVLFNIFIYPVVGSNQFYFSNTGDATKINAANFANAETSPDPILEVATLADEIYFFGSRTVEPWSFTGSLTAPFALAEGRTYARGCAAQGSVVKADNALIWVGDDLSVYRASAVPQKISTPFIDDTLRLAKANIDSMYAFTVGLEGHRWYVINLPGIGESYAYDFATTEWARWGSAVPFTDEPGTFMGQCSAGEGADIYVGSASDGRVWKLDPAANTDDGELKRIIVTGAIWTLAGKQRLNNVGLQCVRGVGNAAAPDPVVQMRMSKDGGRTFGGWLSASLGRVGEYTIKAVWRGLGLISQPGVLFEFSVEDPVNFTVEGATYNEGRY
jgi:hypothetical protein